ncbi:MAG TPA: hypothetical protein VH560_18865 [Polyangia bacterium]|nr:hypothetical protein [Polyangia bacterium]
MTPVEPAAVEPQLTLPPPAILRDLAPRRLARSFADDRNAKPRGAHHQFGPATRLSLSILWLAVHGDGQAGFSTFLGFSAASFGGLRLRF